VLSTGHTSASNDPPRFENIQIRDRVDQHVYEAIHRFSEHGAGIIEKLYIQAGDSHVLKAIGLPKLGHRIRAADPVRHFRLARALREDLKLQDLVAAQFLYDASKWIKADVAGEAISWDLDRNIRALARRSGDIEDAHYFAFMYRYVFPVFIGVVGGLLAKAGLDLADQRASIVADPAMLMSGLGFALPTYFALKREEIEGHIARRVATGYDIEYAVFELLGRGFDIDHRWFNKALENLLIDDPSGDLRAAAFRLGHTPDELSSYPKTLAAQRLRDMSSAVSDTIRRVNGEMSLAQLKISFSEYKTGFPRPRPVEQIQEHLVDLLAKQEMLQEAMNTRPNRKKRNSFSHRWQVHLPTAVDD